MISKYLTRANVDINVSQIEGALSELDNFIAETANKQEAVWSFMIPELGEGGACSLFGHLQEAPFELESYLVRSPQSDLR